MTQVATPGPTVLDALSLLAEVGDQLVVRTVRDTHLAVLDRTSAGPVHRGIATALYGGLTGGSERRRLRRSTGWPRRVWGRGSRTDPRGRFVSSAVNGLIGDRLLRERPQLAIPMAVRLHGADVEPEPESLAGAFPEATGRLVVFLHGLCENESYWRRHRDRTGTTYAEMLGRARLDAADAARQHRAAAARERRSADRTPAAGGRGVAGPGHAHRPGRPLPRRAGDAGRRRGGQRGRRSRGAGGSPT